MEELEELIKAPIDNEGYMISLHWWKAFLENKASNSPVPEIDNSDLVELDPSAGEPTMLPQALKESDWSIIRLKPEIKQNEDFILVNWKAWRALLEKYQGYPEIPIFLIDLQPELSPFVLSVKNCLVEPPKISKHLVSELATQKQTAVFIRRALNIPEEMKLNILYGFDFSMESNFMKLEENNLLLKQKAISSSAFSCFIVREARPEQPEPIKIPKQNKQQKKEERFEPEQHQAGSNNWNQNQNNQLYSMGMSEDEQLALAMEMSLAVDKDSFPELKESSSIVKMVEKTEMEEVKDAAPSLELETQFQLHSHRIEAALKAEKIMIKKQPLKEIQRSLEKLSRPFPVLRKLPDLS